MASSSLLVTRRRAGALLRAGLSAAAAFLLLALAAGFACAARAQQSGQPAQTNGNAAPKPDPAQNDPVESFSVPAVSRDQSSPAAPAQPAPQPAPAPAAPPAASPAPATEPPASQPAPQATSQPAAPADSGASPLPQEAAPPPSPRPIRINPYRDARVDLYGGYSYLVPSGSVNGYEYKNISLGAVTSASFYLNRYLGLQAEAGFHPEGPNDCIYSAMGGPVLRLAGHRLVPFAHADGGAVKVGGPRFQPCTWGYGVTAGGGADLILPGFGQHLALRLAQADYQYMHVDFGAADAHNLVGGEASIQAFRVSTGLVLRLGSLAPPLPILAACSMQPDTVHPGEPAVMNVTVDRLNPKAKTVYTFSGPEMRFEHIEGPAASIDTKLLHPGTYVVTSNVTQGDRPWQNASCSAKLVVQVFPPSVSCVASPSSVEAGQPSTITAVGVSPSNRALVYTFDSDAGRITGNGSIATLDTGGTTVPATITVRCKVEDDTGNTAVGTTTVAVRAPAMAAAVPQAQELCSLSFERDRRRPVRVDNESKACLDDVALTMGHQPDARLVMVGKAAPGEPAPDLVSAERVLNARLYLTKEKGIDPTRIEVRTGTQDGRLIKNYLLPAGVKLNLMGTSPVDEKKYKAKAPFYGVPHR